MAGDTGIKVKLPRTTFLFSEKRNFSKAWNNPLTGGETSGWNNLSRPHKPPTYINRKLYI
jgi:hypothetical protein